MRHLIVLTALLAAGLFPATAGARVMNGDDAIEGDYPWTVALVTAGDPPVVGQFCGGALIDDDVVVTAAHCTVGSRADSFDVFAGDVDLTDVEDGQRIAVDTVHVVSLADVEGDDTRFDVSVLKLAEPAVAPAAPIDLVAPEPAETGWEPETDLEVMGWGRWDEPGFPDVLQHATVDRWEDEDCDLPGYGFDPADMLCALRVAGEDVIDSCQGDSGGPLTTIGADPQDPSDWALVGLVSYGSQSCAEDDQPGVYARLANPALNTFAGEFLDVDEGNDDPAQLERVSGQPDLTGTKAVGGQIACDAGDTEWTDDADLELTLLVRLYDPVAEEYETVGTDAPYDLGSGDAGELFVCEVQARKDGVGGFGVARSDLYEIPFPSAETDPPPPEPAPIVPPVGPPPPDPQPFVPEPRDIARPATTLIRRRCVRRRCTFTIEASDGIAGSGIRTVTARLVSPRRCRRNGRRAICTRFRALTATSTGNGVFRVRSPRLKRGVLHRLRVRAVDNAGNLETRSRVFSFRLGALTRAAR